jgi:hypothetical protein
VGPKERPGRPPRAPWRHNLRRAYKRRRPHSSLDGSTPDHTHWGIEGVPLCPMSSECPSQSATILDRRGRPPIRRSHRGELKKPAPPMIRMRFSRCIATLPQEKEHLCRQLFGGARASRRRQKWPGEAGSGGESGEKLKSKRQTCPTFQSHTAGGQRFGLASRRFR